MKAYLAIERQLVVWIRAAFSCQESGPGFPSHGARFPTTIMDRKQTDFGKEMSPAQTAERS